MQLSSDLQQRRWAVLSVPGDAISSKNSPDEASSSPLCSRSNALGAFQPQKPPTPSALRDNSFFLAPPGLAISLHRCSDCKQQFGALEPVLEEVEAVQAPSLSDPNTLELSSVHLHQAFGKEEFTAQPKLLQSWECKGVKELALKRNCRETPQPHTASSI